jgi:hypothetical protein
MRTITACLICFTLLTFSILSTIAQENQTAPGSQALPGNNTTLGNNTSVAINASQQNKTLSLSAIHVGLTSAKSIDALGRPVPRTINNVDMYGNKSVYNVSAYSYIKPLHTVNNTVKAIFNVENRNPVRPLFNASGTSIKAIKELGSYDQSTPVQDLSGYSLVKVPNNIA